jgi:hypothetical protein
MAVLKFKEFEHTKQRTIGELEDEIKHRDRRIEELRGELDEERELVRKLRENAEEYRESIESWCESFGMEMTDDGQWSWKPFWDENKKLIDDYNALVRDWNRFLPIINGHGGRNAGRPLEASRAQRYEVVEMRFRGASLRAIAEATSLTLATVRTIIGKQSGKDRTTKKHRQRAERIEIDRERKAKWKRQRRGDNLPKRMTRYVNETTALIKQAKQ